VRRLRLLISVCVLGVAASAPASALASTSRAVLWTALGRTVTCGIAIHPPNTPPIEVLCAAPAVPAPKTGFGDPGFVFLRSVGRPSLARLSQDSFVGTHPVVLSSGAKWRGGPIKVACTISARAVTCSNGSHHGFTITKDSYRAF
jgi:hypothetical protein